MSPIQRLPAMSTSFRTNIHVRNEIKFDHVENWTSTRRRPEEEAVRMSPRPYRSKSTGRRTLHRELSRLRVTTFARAVSRRRSSLSFGGTYFPQRLRQCRERTRNLRPETAAAPFCASANTRTKTSSRIVTASPGVRASAVAVLDASRRAAAPVRATLRRCWIQARKVRRLEDGFFSISGAAVDASGKVYFCRSP